MLNVKRKHAKILQLVFKRPASANIRFMDVKALILDLGGTVDINREGSRVAFVLFGEMRVFHNPHPSPCMDKAAVEALRDWLKTHGVKP